MKFKFFLLFFSFSLSILLAQEVQKFDTILKIENLEFHPKEIRVYRDFSTSTGLELFRMFYDENDKISVEFYYTVARTLNDGKLEIRIRKKNLDSFKNPKWIWMELIYSKILNLPDFDEIRYKLTGKAKIIIDEGEIGAETSEIYILDGVGYNVQIKNRETFKQLDYPNPESYLEKFPDVDEIIIFNDFLNILKEEYNIFKK